MNTEKKLIPLLRFPAFIQDGGWKEYKLGDIAQFYKGKGISKNDVTDNGTIPCIRYGELYTHYKEVIDEVTSYTDLSIDDLFMSKANDITQLFPTFNNVINELKSKSKTNCIIF